MRRILSLGTALWVAAASFAQAETSPVVVELFTSQGCSSCPPADKLLHDLSRRDDVIPLALHIDYWDYIGWKDAFANPDFTRRQKGYASASGRKMIYTPQMIIDGQDDVVGNRPMDVSELIAKHHARENPVDLDIVRSGNALSIEASAGKSVGKADIFVVRYDAAKEIKILRGENSGKTLTYSHIVTDWTRIGTWDGRADLEMETRIKGDSPVVVLVQSSPFGPILAAARLR